MVLSSYIRAGLSYARRNAAKIALIAVAASATVAVNAHLRRQSRAINDTLRSDRLEGAKKLRSVFISNSHSICAAFRSLLPNLRSILSTIPSLDTAAPLGRLREHPTDLSEKHALWQRLMVASMSHLTASIYLTSLLYSFLSLQMNLLARYNLPDDMLDGAPPRQLPTSPLTALTSKAFLDIILNVVLDSTHVNRVVLRIESVVKNVTADVDLTKKPSTRDIAELLTTILDKSWSETHVHRDFNDNEEQVNNGAEQDDNDNISDGSSLSAMLHSWLFDDVSAQCGPHRNAINDVNYSWLVGELLDLCEVLDFNQYVYSNSLVVRDFVMRRLRDEVDSNQVAKRPTFARLLARFSSLAATVVSGREEGTLANVGNASSSSSVPVERDIHLTSVDSLDRCLAENDVGMYFAASVFLSGERNSSTRMTHA